MNNDKGGSAFPDFKHDGMTLRDYFAAKAITGMAGQFHEHWTTLGAAQAAYELADAMLAERSK